ncbi:MAG: hypothetical protein AB7N53_18460, partial [Candidatus Binatia bacterium]
RRGHSDRRSCGLHPAFGVLEGDSGLAAAAYHAGPLGVERAAPCTGMGGRADPRGAAPGWP